MIFARYMICDLYPNVLRELHHEIIDLMLVRKRSGHELLLHTPLTPCHQLGTLGLYAEVPKSLKCVEPGVKWEKSNVQKPQALTTKVRIGFKLSFQ